MLIIAHKAFKSLPLVESLNIYDIFYVLFLN